MLNSNIVKLAETLDKLCVEGYNTIDKCDILSLIESDFNLVWDNQILLQEINNLASNKFIILKYQDDDVLCLSFSSDGKELLSRIKIAREEEANRQKSKKQLKEEQKAKAKQSNKEQKEEDKQLGQEEIMAGLVLSSKSKTKTSSGLKSFLIGLLGGVLGGGISGTIITLLVMFL